MDTTMKTKLAPMPHLVLARRHLCDRLDAALKGHPKPALVAKLEAEIDAFDAKNPDVRKAL